MKKLLSALFTLLAAGSAVLAATPYDFDGDGRSDYAVSSFELLPGTTDTRLMWYIVRSSDGTLQTQQFGLDADTDKLRPADYDGDGRTDIAVQRTLPNQVPTTFYILNSSNNTLRVETFGRYYDDSNVIGDYDGDGKADLCVYGLSGKNYSFMYRGSLNNPNGVTTVVPLNRRSGTPYKGDFDGDGRLDFCVRYTFSTSPPVFTVKRSSDAIFENVNWGVNSDELAPGDYDGDGRTDFGVRRSNGANWEWYILERDGGGTGASPIVFGISNLNVRYDITFSGADFDGDRKSDIGVYTDAAPNAGLFYIRKSGDGGLLTYNLGLGPTGGFYPIYGFNFI